MHRCAVAYVRCGVSWAGCGAETNVTFRSISARESGIEKLLIEDPASALRRSLRESVEVTRPDRPKRLRQTEFSNSPVLGSLGRSMSRNVNPTSSAHTLLFFAHELGEIAATGFAAIKTK